MKTSYVKASASYFVNIALAFITGKKAKPSKAQASQLKRDVVAQQKLNHSPYLGREAIASTSVAEESLDFIGEDTSERLGAVRLRKV